MIKLNSIPKELEATYNEIIKSPKFSVKFDRDKRINEKLQYISSYMPEISKGGYKILDIGTGPGEFLEVLRNYNCTGIGINPPDNHRWSEIRDTELANYHEESIIKYNTFSKINIFRQKLDVLSIDMFSCFTNGNKELEKMKFNIINCQDAINLILIKYYDLNYAIDNYKNHHIFGKWILSEEFYSCLKLMIKFFDKILLPGGAIMLVALISSNDQEYSQKLIHTAKELGYNIEISKDYHIHKFRKTE